MTNLVVLQGRLTADPELKTTPNGLSVTSFSIAVDRNYQNTSERQADFINIVAWRQTAEFITKYFTKGRSILICGRLQSRSWEKDGQRRTAVEVVADEATFVDKKPDAAPADPAPATPYGGDSRDFVEQTPDDDLPF